MAKAELDLPCSPEVAKLVQEQAAEIKGLRLRITQDEMIEADMKREIERLTEDLQDCQSRAITQRGELRAEIERLRFYLRQNLAEAEAVISDSKRFPGDDEKQNTTFCDR